MKLTENTILITGGTSGIGRALAEAFHQRGNKVIIAGRRKALLDEIAAANPGIDTVELDIGNAEQIRDVARHLIERYPSLNVLINNAGIMPFDDAAGAVDDEQAVRLVNTNLLGPVRMSGALVEHLKKQPQSYIVNNSSVLAYVPLAATALYSATKAAIHSYSMSQRFALRATPPSVCSRSRLRGSTPTSSTRAATRVPCPWTPSSPRRSNASRRRPPRWWSESRNRCATMSGRTSMLSSTRSINPSRKIRFPSLDIPDGSMRGAITHALRMEQTGTGYRWRAHT